MKSEKEIRDEIQRLKNRHESSFNYAAREDATQTEIEWAVKICGKYVIKINTLEWVLGESE